MIAHSEDKPSRPKPQSFTVKVLRKNGPGQPSYWAYFTIPYEPELNVISVLQKIAARGQEDGGKKCAPVCWDCNCLEEVCGACTMVINGKVRQSCSALIDVLLDEHGSTLELRPMTKFPVVRDLMVDRSRMFQVLKKVKAWVPVDGYYDLGPGPKQSMAAQEASYPLSECMTCGCCVEACPQYSKIELDQQSGESTEAFQERKAEAYDENFIGPQAISQVVLFNMNPTGHMNKRERMDAVTAEGGVQVCGNAQNCVAVCPKHIPLTRSIAKVGRDATFHTLKKWFDWS